MINLPEILFGTGAAAVAAAVWGFLRSEVGQALIERLRRVSSTEVLSLKDAVDNLSQVVSTQGESISWLRAELDTTRLELIESRTALNNQENYLASENDKLRNRITELEEQVRALESALLKKSKTTNKTTTSERRIK